MDLLKIITFEYWNGKYFFSHIVEVYYNTSAIMKFLA